MSEFSNQTIIERAIIRKIDGSELNLISQNQGNTPFFRMLIQESMLQPSVSGTLFVQDKGSYGESINLWVGKFLKLPLKPQ